MQIKDFIEKAIEGGWNKYVWEFYRRTEVESGFSYKYPIDSVFLDPLAWQAVGKVEGWPDEGFQGKYGDYLEQRWLGRMHAMIDALAEGKTITEYLETL